MSLLDAYPHIEQAISCLCQGASWTITGVSAIVFDRSGELILELAKPKHWQETLDGQTMIGIGAIGGSIEPGEGLVDCLRRETQEELGADIVLQSAHETFLVYEEQLAHQLESRDGQFCPLFFTISANLYRHAELPDSEILAIATYIARLKDDPKLGDLWGLMRIPVERIDELMCLDVITADDLAQMPDIGCVTRAPFPHRFVLKPVWTVRSLQVLTQLGRNLRLTA